MTPISHALVILTTMQGLAAPLMAESAPALPTKERMVRTLFFKRPADMPTTAVLWNQANTIQVNLPPMNLSDPVGFPAGDLVFAVLPEAPQADAPIPPGAPQIKVPAAWRQVLLLFFSDPANPVFPVRVLPVDGSLDKFKPGELLCFNLSTAEVGGSLGEAKFRIASGKSGILKPSRTESGDYPVSIDCLLAGDPRPRPLCRTTWRHDPGIRQLLFIVHADDRPVPRIWSISETVTTPEN